MSKTHNKDRQALRANTYTTKQAMADLRTHMLSSFSGSLATLCREGHPLAGYPVSSVVPFVLDDAFRPVVLVAHVAEHTCNVLADPKASIFLRERYDGGDVQAQWRICMIGDLLKVPDDELAAVAEKYYAHYPQSRDYDHMHNFYFFRLEIKKYRIIMGFGDIRWVAGNAPYTDCPFVADKARMIEHMNADHVDSMRNYLRRLGVDVDDGDTVVMTDIHQYGVVLRYQGELYFLPFPEPATDAVAVRKAVVDMARKSRAAVDQPGISG